jgi:hypothetical protein
MGLDRDARAAYLDNVTAAIAELEIAVVAGSEGP